MGYTTDFSGCFDLNKPLNKEMSQYLRDFSESRHFKIAPETVKLLDPAWKDHCLFGEPGYDFQFYLTKYITHSTVSLCGADREIRRAVEYNDCPSDIPGLWCQWVPSCDDKHIKWDGNEKFYGYVDWIAWLIKYILAPNGYVLNGCVRWQGEDFFDVGEITIRDNVVAVRF